MYFPTFLDFNPMLSLELLWIWNVSKAGASAIAITGIGTFPATKALVLNPLCVVIAILQVILFEYKKLLGF